MMEVFFFYIIKSSLCLVLFFLFFKVLLSKETFFRFNRFVLLAGIVICAILPLIQFQTEKKVLIQTPILEIEKLILSDTPKTTRPIEIENIMDESAYPSTKNIQENKSNLSTWNNLSQTQLLCLIYGIGFLFTLSGLTISVFRMIRLMRNGKKINQNNFTIILLKEKICPFSFGKYIVMSEIDYLQNPNEILTHEQIHAQKKHSLDLLFAEIFILLHWFNPVVWLLKKEMQDIHEYEADNGVIKSGIDATQYQLLLVKKAVGARSYAIANSFNHSKIKNRITMMLKRKSTQWARLKLVLFVPLAAVALQAFARPEIARIQESLNNSEVTNFIQESSQVIKDFSSNEKDAIIVMKKDTAAKRPSAPPPPLLRIADSEEVPMNDQEKAATKEFEVASQKFSLAMSKHAAEIEKSINAPAMQKLTKEFEESAQKFEKAMQSFQSNYEQMNSKEMEAQSKVFEEAAAKFGKVMEEHASEIENGIESQEVKAAKEQFKAASDKFKVNMEQVKNNMKDMKDSPELRTAQDEFKKAGEKYKDGMKEYQVDMKAMKDDPDVLAAKEEFKAASEKFKQAMRSYQERVENSKE